MVLLPRRRTRLLLTGDRGSVGRWLKPLLKSSGYEVVGFDVRDGHDVTDGHALEVAASSTDAIVHLATLPWGYTGPDTEMERVNAGGTRNVLRAAEAAGHTRVTVFSSPHVFGVISGDVQPRSFPIRDDHPRAATEPYGASKVQLEDLCAEFTARTGIATFCPRPFHVWVPGQAVDVRRKWDKRPELERESWRSLAAFVDVRDVATAVDLAQHVPAEGHHRFILCAEDIAASRTTREVAHAAFPDVPLEDGWPPAGAERAALADAGAARTLLGWTPRYSWTSESRLSLGGRAWGRVRRARTMGLFPR